MALFCIVHILSKELGLFKPDANLFKIALEKRNIPVNRVAYVGNRYDNDIIPAKSLGMRTVHMLKGMGRYAVESKEWKSDWKLLVHLKKKKTRLRNQSSFDIS